MKMINIILLVIMVSLSVMLIFGANKTTTKNDVLGSSEINLSDYVVNMPGDENSKEALVKKGLSVATFSGGCFWCSESDFESQDGVLLVVSGYSDGDEPNPTYELVSSGKTKYRESIQIIYNGSKISYAKLLEIYWRNIDPTDEGGQFADRGYQYTTAIYYHNGEQEYEAKTSIKVLDESGKYDKKIVTKVLPFKNFYLAENYHQDYSKKNPTRYKLYRKGSGKDAYIKSTWGNSSPNLEIACTLDLDKLTPEQYKITQENKTELPFKNEYWDNHEEGIYVDVVSGEPLFSSTDKFDSKSGWPSFSKPINETEIVELEDNSLGIKRTEIRSLEANSHLGHLFDDGPQELGGERYCVNSASLKFIPKDKMKEKGYGDYMYLFN